MNINVGSKFKSLGPEIDSDEHGNERSTPAGSIWRIADRNGKDLWDLVCDATGAWICPTSQELATQFEAVA